MSHRSFQDGATGRGGASAEGGSAEPPPAPPLPPQPSSARVAANALARFAENINSRTSASTRKLPAAGLISQRRSRLEGIFSPLHQALPQVSPLGPARKSSQVLPEIDKASADRIHSLVSSRSISHRTGIPIAALDISPCRTRAVLAGRDILKTVAVTGSSCNEDYNLRERIVRYAATHQTAAGTASSKHKDHLAANDVKWSHGDFHATIATAATNGQIVVYDLNRPGVELARLHEHNRQVHKLGFNPHRGSLLLSGSQDATTRLWDLRALAGERSVMTCNSKNRYTGNSEGVRDLHWSPTNGVEFAIGTDSGVIQRWDIRKESSPTLKVNAHEKTCNSIEWHPDGKHIASGSADKRVKIWDFSSSDRRMKPLWQLRVPQAAVHARWRPASLSSEDHRPGHWHCTQLAVSYDKEDPRVHVWDLRRPFVPSRVLSSHETSPTALLWHSGDLLWSVDSAGIFFQSNIRAAPVTMNRYSVNAVDIRPDGQIVFASMKRERERLSLENVTDDLLSIERRETNKSGRASAGHSSTPGSHEDANFFNASFKHRRGKASHSLNSAKTMSTTSSSPAAGSSTSTDDTVIPLEQSLQDKHMYKNPQVMAIGYVPGLVNADAFVFMARHTMAPSEMNAGKKGYNLHLMINEAFMHNAGVAAAAGQHGLAMSWKMMALAARMELGKRAERNYQRRVAAVASEEAQLQSSNTQTTPVPASVAENNNNLASEVTELAPENAASTNSRKSESGKTEPLIFSYDEMNPLKAFGQPPSDEAVVHGHIYVKSDFHETEYQVGWDPNFPPWTATAMFLPLLRYHMNALRDAQIPAYMILHLLPWLHVHTDRPQLEKVLATYHQALLRFELYVEAAELRIHCKPDYPNLLTTHDDESMETVGPFCTNCNKPSLGSKPNYCERCKKQWAPCSICHGYGVLLNDRPTDKDTIGLPRATNPHADDRLWSWCQNCGHGGHTGCLRAFWDFSEEGACPALGCTCDCVPGTWRDEIVAGLEEQWRREGEAGPVTRDSWTVRESGAVQRTRSTVGASGAKKSVRFAH